MFSYTKPTCGPTKITGTQPFGSLELRVRKPVLIPRPETEDWTLHVASLITPSSDRPVKLLDLCTGTGCIPLLLAHIWPTGSVQALGVDISQDAVSLARENASLVGLSNASSPNQTLNTFEALEADILKDDLLGILTSLGWAPVNILTSNPPYIPLHEYNKLSPSVKDYEDIRALLGDPGSSLSDLRGLTFYRRIAALVRDGIVNPDGLIALEVGRGQADDVRDIMQLEGQVREADIRKDPWGIARTVLCRR